MTMGSEAQFTRELRIAREVIDRFELDLQGMCVATEAATGHFRWTALLALLAGADRVVAVGKDSPYASAKDACAAVERLAVRAGLAQNLEVTTDPSAAHAAEIVTNLRGLRPFDASRIAQLRAGTALPLMCEAWEHRAADVDLAAAERQGVIVMGTNEHHPELDFMRYVGLLGLKLAMEAGVELLHSRVIVVGGGPFGKALCKAFEANGAQCAIVCPDSERAVLASNWIGPRLGAPIVMQELRWADLLVFGDYTTEAQHVGADSLDPHTLAANNPGLAVAHIAGLVDASAMREAGLQLVPGTIATLPRTMSVTTGYLGVRPVLELHGAGLKVGEICSQAWRTARCDSVAARRIALMNPLCQEFPAHVLSRYSMPLTNAA